LVDAGLRPVQRGARVAGSAVTVLCQAGDNLMLHAAVEGGDRGRRGGRRRRRRGRRARTEAPSVADAAEARLAREVRTRARLAAGELGIDIYGLRNRLAALGVEYVDGPGGA
jgi:regulator of RNase E activity RraA